MKRLGWTSNLCTTRKPYRIARGQSCNYFMIWKRLLYHSLFYLDELPLCFSLNYFKGNYEITINLPKQVHFESVIFLIVMTITCHMVASPFWKRKREREKGKTFILPYLSYHNLQAFIWKQKTSLPETSQATKKGNLPHL